jgi:hypothetical protein
MHQHGRELAPPVQVYEGEIRVADPRQVDRRGTRGAPRDNPVPVSLLHEGEAVHVLGRREDPHHAA